MEFAKLHGLGNDFLITGMGDAVDMPRPMSTLARQICDRHRGVGADGVVFYQPTIGDPEADVSALIFNADGSRAEMSGNGVRCLAAQLYRTGRFRTPALRIRTVSGIKTYSIKMQEAEVYTFESSMGTPILNPARIPAVLDGPGPILNHPLTLGSEHIQVSLCSMGNPHCSTFWSDVIGAPVDTIGPLLERHTLFPNRTNVEFIQVIDRSRIRVLFWERGVGRTLASGTGSSAAAVAAILHKFVESPVTVDTGLGTMRVSWKPGEELFLTGPAEFICSGTYVQREHEELS
jgi:diaminopimelate epimerase